MDDLAWHVVYLILADVLLGLLLVAAYAVTGVQWFKSTFRGWDYFNAALAGGDGKHSISAYCGRAMLRPDGSNLLVTIGIAINFVFGDGHCEEAARKEGLV